MKVLIVEDEVKIREGMANLIRRHTAHTVVGQAHTGREGLEMARRYRPHLIITDIRMPDMDGLEMLEALFEEKLLVHAVILSGYSEFDYAKKAIRLGVDDYLLKPIGTEDILDMLEKTAGRIAKEEREREAFPEKLLRGLLTEELPRDMWEQLWEHCRIRPQSPWGVFLGEFSLAPPGYQEWLQEQIKAVAESLCCPSFSFSVTDAQGVCLFVTDAWNSLSRVFAEKILDPRRREPIPWAFGPCPAAEQLSGVLRDISPLLAYAIPLGTGVLLTETLVSAFRPEACVYPAELQNKLKGMICSGDRAGVKECQERFLAFLHLGGFAPEDSRQCCIRLLTFVIALYQEVDHGVYEQVRGQGVLEQAVHACTMADLDSAVNKTFQPFASAPVKKDDIRNYTIQKALRYIREHFREGITLEETAGILEITPEYLSTLFNREVGVHFSTFLKQFRMSHARRLLKGSQLKIFEIAEQVGYPDPKYFIRVFKEEYGVSPGKYRDG